MDYKLLFEVSVYRKDRISSDMVDKENYISTENMLPNRGGVEIATTVASAKTFPAYKKGDILLSNIRPYFKKIWYADKEGGCSNDVLVVKGNKTVDNKFLYYVLSDNNFFNYSTVTSKGTKMPRGSKNAIMKYWVPDLDLPIQRKIADILSYYYIVIVILYLFHRLDYAILRYCGLVHFSYHLMVYTRLQPQSLCSFVNQLVTA